jgi:hypothetical protein
MGKGYMRRRDKATMVHRGACFKEGCKDNGGTIHTCITCESLVANDLARRGEDYGTLINHESVFKVQCCAKHYNDGLTKVKRHALTAHPVNILRVMAAGLKGEKI